MKPGSSRRICPAWMPRRDIGGRSCLAAFALLILLSGELLQAGALNRASVTSSGGTPAGSSTAGNGTSVPAATGTSAQSAAQQAAAAQRTGLALSRASAALQAAQKAQTAARAAALAAASSIPNGLTGGGLVPDAGLSVSLTNITLPSNTTATLSSAVPAGTLSTNAAGKIVNPDGTVTLFHSGDLLPAMAGGSTIVFTSGDGQLKVADGSSGASFKINLASGTAYSYADATGRSSWRNVGNLTESVDGSGDTTVTAYQTDSQALLNWSSFNLGKATTLYFDQTRGGSDAGNWVAFNTVNDPSGSPSQILGKIQAAGQVYVINQNGIVFGGSSQVNAHGLVASSLPINTNLLTSGLLNNNDLQFLFSSLTVSAVSGGTMPAFNPPAAPNTATGRNGDVVVEAGAILSATPVYNQSTSEIVSNPSFKLSQIVASGKSPTVSYTPSGTTSAVTLVAGSDYSLSRDSADGKTVVTLTGAGLSKVSTAQVNVSYTPVDTGGRIALIGPNVTNRGIISTPEGQTILAAGNQVALLAHDSNDPTLRGLDVYIGAVDAYSGVATNEGMIDIPRADVTIAGKTVNQSGVIEGSTSVALNGRIDLLANYGSRADYIPGVGFKISPSQTGTVTLGTFTAGGATYGSVTEILPEWASADTVVGRQLALNSIINIQGLTIHLAQDAASQSAAEILAPGGTVTLSAGAWVSNSGTRVFESVTGRGQVVLDSGAMINVAGSQDVAASVVENSIAVQLLGTELADDALQKNGILRGETVYVDVRDFGTNSDGSTWIGTALANTSGYVNLMARTVGELTTGGGSVSIQAGQSFSMQSGSSIDVSGGWTNYQGGIVKTTKLISNGTVYDISQASANLVYSGIESATGSYEAGYVQGGDAGSLSVTAPNMTLQGGLYGNKVTGLRQRQLNGSAVSYNGGVSGTASLPGIVTAGTAIPKSATLSLNFTSVSASGGQPESPGPNLYFESNPALAPAGAVVIPADITSARGGGFGNLLIDASVGTITLPSEVTLTAGAGGSFHFSAASMDMEGSVVVPGGTLNFTTFAYSPYEIGLRETPSGPNAGWGTFTLSGILDTSGLFVNDSLDAAAPLAINGGSVSIRAYTVDLEGSSGINVSGGVYRNAAGKLAYGNGGGISIYSGQDPAIASLLGGTIRLDGTLSGYGVGMSGATGGALTISAPLVQIGGTASGDPGVLNLTSDFFDQGGFSNFTIQGIGDPANSATPAFRIASDAKIDPQVKALQVDLNGTGVALSPVLPEASSRSPVRLVFSAAGARDSFDGTVLARGDFLMEEGASISIDPRRAGAGSVAIGGDTAAILGSIVVPGGSIAVTGNSSYVVTGTSTVSTALPTVDLGHHSVLSTKGQAVLTPNAYGYRTGSVLNGGSITVSGNIVAESGARVDVSGGSAILDLSPVVTGSGSGRSLSRANAMAATRVDSGGGSITFTGKQELFMDATLLGAAGGATATGGTLTIGSGRYYAPGQSANATALDTTLYVTQSGSTFLEDYYPEGATAVGQAVQTAGNQPAAGYFTADRFNDGGFDSLALKGTVQFTGAVTLDARGSITVGTGGVIYADAPVHLNASYAALGQAFAGPLAAASLSQSVFTVGSTSTYFSPVTGTGNLTVSANLIDVGNLLLMGVGQLNLVAEGTRTAGGSIRGDGTLDIAGNVSMRAGQIYPVTATSFTIAAYGDQSSVTIESSANPLPSLPLSGGGVLTIEASVIRQGGVLRAPLGTINLGWDGVGTAPFSDPIAGTTATLPTTQLVTLASGSITSVSAVDPVTGKALLIPYGTVDNGTAWIDPSGTDITAGGLSGKAVNLSAVSVDIQDQVTDANGKVIKAKASIDVSGGGDLYAYDWVSGTGGTKDILASTASFAIVPGYAANYAPVDLTEDSGGNRVYTNSNIKVGDVIYLSGGNGLPAGTYTVLPARYALLAGAYLVTPQGGTPTGTSLTRADGSTLVAGYRYNSLNGSRTVQPLLSQFEVASVSVVNQRTENDLYSANAFLKNGAVSHDKTAPRLPVDAGQVSLSALSSMTLGGSIVSHTVSGGLGSLVDIGSPSDIVIGSAGGSVAGGVLFLDAGSLSEFGADSLLIGGFRTTTTNGVTVTATTRNLTVDNAGETLFGPDIILVSNGNLTVAGNADIEQRGGLSSAAQTLLLSGDSVLVRVSSDTSASISHTSLGTSSSPVLSIGANAKISGAALLLDSTGDFHLSPTANLDGASVALGAGQISIVLGNPGAVTNGGLILSGAALDGLQNSARDFSLTGYTSIDFFGSGAIGGSGVSSLALYSAAIRGFSNSGNVVTVTAKNLTLGNVTGAVASGGAGPSEGALEFHADTIQLGSNALQISQYSRVSLDAANGIIFNGTGGLTTPDSLVITAPVITGGTGANETIAAGGDLVINQTPGHAASSVSGGLGAALSLSGSTVTVAGTVSLSSGTVTVRASSGDVAIGGTIDTSGQGKTYYNVKEYTGGGRVSLVSETGNVVIASGGVVNVSAPAGGGDAGTMTVSATSGVFNDSGTVLGKAGAGGAGGVFSLDVGTLSSTETLDTQLTAGGFDYARSYRVRNGNVAVEGHGARAHSYTLSADNGSILVNGLIDAAGSAVAYGGATYTSSYTTGGTINLVASRNVILDSGSLLTVAAEKFGSAGKGGAISLEAGANVNGAADPGAFVGIRAGSALDFSVAAATATSAAVQGDFTGTLLIRAPRTADNSDVNVETIAGTISNASTISVEGNKIYNLTSSTGSTIAAAYTNSVSGVIATEARAFLGSNGDVASANYTSMYNRIFGELLASTPALAPAVVLAPAVEIVNTQGDLTLADNWDLSSFRFGPNGAAGSLTIRAAGNLTVTGALSDGFRGYSDPYTGQYVAATDYRAVLMDSNGNLPLNDQSWSYRLVAGADFSAADSREVIRHAGSFQLGVNAGTNASTDGSLQSAIAGHYQVVRTGTGDIDVMAGTDILFRNQFSSIYTAGALVADPSMNGTFDVPQAYSDADFSTAYYGSQYSLAGGNVTVEARGDIKHVTMNTSGTWVDDSVGELPNNWLYRRGYVDSTGKFGISLFGEVASTSWWVDFSNFFESVGALGGGNVTLVAGNDITNVDAVIPTNARMPGKDAGGSPVAPNAAQLVELGGGDLTVRAGNSINGGVYYVEQGQGSLVAGNEILTNATRAPVLPRSIASSPYAYSSETWLPTTLFIGGDSTFTVSARNDVLLGPVVNPFLLASGVANSYAYKTYFSTYEAGAGVDVTSLTGDVTFREVSTLPASKLSNSILLTWMNYTGIPSSFSLANYQSWLGWSEDNLLAFGTVAVLMPPTLDVKAYSGDINLVGPLTLSPSAQGNLNLIAGGSINGLQSNGSSLVLVANSNVTTWNSSTINLSDADPDKIPGVSSPLAYAGIVGNLESLLRTSAGYFLSSIDSLFAESGSYAGTHGVLQSQQALHDSAILHAEDPTGPVHLYAEEGNISGLTLFSAKSSEVISGRDITDVALYIQNVKPTDVSIVAAGRDIIAYDASSPLRLAATTGQNAVNSDGVILAGDIQISGPGTLEVLAGRNLDLGAGAANSDGTGVGLTSIGNLRNPALGSAGADLIAAAGIGDSYGLGRSQINFGTVTLQGGQYVVSDAGSFLAQFLCPATAGDRASLYLPQLADWMGLPAASSDAQIWEAFGQLGSSDSGRETQAKYALDLFYLVLRNAGRDHNAAGSAGYGNYDEGYAAIRALLTTTASAPLGQGNIILTSREIKTVRGGDIALFAPGGALDVGIDAGGKQAIDQGILTVDGGNISIYTYGDVNVGTSRIFTLHGGNVAIWSSAGDIAAGASSKTVQSAPPTRVVINPQSGNVETDLGGLATGGGIGVLASIAGVPPGDVDLIAPLGTIDAGDAGIRSTGNVSLAAQVILNASNIQAGSGITGAPAPVSVASPSLGALTSASNASNAASSSAAEGAGKNRNLPGDQTDIPSIIVVEVLGYGGDESDSVQ